MQYNKYKRSQRRDSNSLVINKTGARKINRQDGWTNAVIGLGGKKDKSQYTTYSSFTFLHDTELSNIYVGNGLARKIIDTKPKDALKNWIKPQITENQRPMDDPVYFELKKIGAQTAITKAMQYARLFGGAIILMGTDDSTEELEEPLRNVKKINWLKVYDKSQINLTMSEINLDPKSSRFKKADKYFIEADSDGSEPLLVHHTRVLEFFGEPVPERSKSADLDLRYWGASTMQTFYDELKDYYGISHSIVNVIYEFIIGKYSLKGLQSMLVAGNETKLRNRMEIIDMMKSMLNSILLAEGETYTRDTANVAGLPELIDRYNVKISAVAGYPVTKLFGERPSGLNTNGEGDMTNYYDDLETIQELIVMPALMKLVSVIGEYVKIPKDYTIEFEPLKSMTAKEQKEIEKIDAEIYQIESNADATNIMNNVLDADEVRKIRGYDEIIENDASKKVFE